MILRFYILLEREGGGILPAITRQQAVNLVRQSVDCGRYATEPEYIHLRGFLNSLAEIYNMRCNRYNFAGFQDTISL